MSSPKPVLTSEELEARLRQTGAERYHNLHRFHRRLHNGQCTYEEVQAWALNRYYYQAMIPIKDATILTRMPDVRDRRHWRKRIEDHDGLREGDGGIERWLKLTDSLGFSRDYVISTQGILSGTRFAVDAYVEFCRARSLLEAIASSLTELFSPAIIDERVAGMLAHYDFVSKETLAYFSQRSVQAKRDSEFALDYVKQNAVTRAGQDAVLAALEFKCSVLWAQLDALWSAYVERAVPPGAWSLDAGIRGHPWSSGMMRTSHIDIVWKPCLARGVRLKYDETRGEWLLLAPERVIKADAIAVEILKRCDGTATFAAIVDDLAGQFSAGRARVETDVRALLEELAAKRMVDM